MPPRTIGAGTHPKFGTSGGTVPRMPDSRRALQVTLVGLGALATSTGIAALARGTAIIRDAPPPDPNVESEHRFMAAWWTALGPVLWSLVPDVERRGRAVDAIAATTFAGGVARLVAMKQVGKPDPLYRFLTAVELALPPVLVAWQRSVRSRCREPGSCRKRPVAVKRQPRRS